MSTEQPPLFEFNSFNEPLKPCHMELIMNGINDVIGDIGIRVEYAKDDFDDQTPDDQALGFKITLRRIHSGGVGASFPKDALFDILKLARDGVRPGEVFCGEVQAVLELVDELDRLRAFLKPVTDRERALGFSTMFKNDTIFHYLMERAHVANAELVRLRGELPIPEVWVCKMTPEEIAAEQVENAKRFGTAKEFRAAPSDKFVVGECHESKAEIKRNGMVELTLHKGLLSKINHEQLAEEVAEILNQFGYGN